MNILEHEYAIGLDLKFSDALAILMTLLLLILGDQYMNFGVLGLGIARSRFSVGVPSATLVLLLCVSVYPIPVR